MRKIYRIENDKNELLWWNIPWESVEPYLLYNLSEQKATGKWRYEYNWEIIGDKEIKILILKEKGHFSDFSSNTYQYKENESKYSEFEQKQMVDEMNEKLDKKEKKEVFWSNNNTLIESEHGNIYACLKDYYDSSEHKFNRQINSDMYARSLYTEHTTQVSTMISNSRHYECIFEIGSFYFDNEKGLQGLSWHPFELKMGEGDIPNNLSEKYKNKDSAVVCAAFICDQYWIQSVLIKLFGSGFTDKADSVAESYQRSQIFTCLSNKLM